jgi:hypothetical protein
MRPGEDGRMHLLRITPKGERTLGKAYPLWEQAQHEFVGALGEDRYEAPSSAMSPWQSRWWPMARTTRSVDQRKGILKRRE